MFIDCWGGFMERYNQGEKNGVVRSSFGFRRTVEKLNKYHNLLIALTVVDAMQVSAIWYMDEFYTITVPMFPFITLFGALGISLIEIKSIYEKTEDKQRFEEVGKLARIIKLFYDKWI